jgi:hypothetical protein
MFHQSLLLTSKKLIEVERIANSAQDVSEQSPSLLTFIIVVKRRFWRQCSGEIERGININSTLRASISLISLQDVTDDFIFQVHRLARWRRRWFAGLLGCRRQRH